MAEPIPERDISWDDIINKNLLLDFEVCYLLFWFNDKKNVDINHKMHAFTNGTLKIISGYLTTNLSLFVVNDH